MKSLLALLLLANLSLAACSPVPTPYFEEIGTAIAAQGTTISATRMAQLTNTLTPDPLRLTQVPATEPPPAATPAPTRPLVTLAVDLNVRTGPGTHYDRIGWLAAGTSVDIIGRTADSSWWQIPYADAPGGAAWIAAGYGTANDTADVPVVDVPPTATRSAPPAAHTPTPASTEAPLTYQYSPTGWYGDTNYGLTRFVGEIRDTAGNPVDGVFVRAVCGSYSTISYPSGPVGWGSFGESSDWPPGFYDITVNTKPVPCMWTLQVVDTDDRQVVKAELSEAVPVEVTNEQSVIQANWRKNW